MAFQRHNPEPFTNNHTTEQQQTYSTINQIKHEPFQSNVITQPITQTNQATQSNIQSKDTTTINITALEECVRQVVEEGKKPKKALSDCGLNIKARTPEYYSFSNRIRKRRDQKKKQSQLQTSKHDFYCRNKTHTHTHTHTHTPHIINFNACNCLTQKTNCV